MPYSIGDKIKIADNGECFSTYKDWAVKYSLESYAIGKMPAYGVKYEITRIGPDGIVSPYGTIYGIENKEMGEQFIVTEKAFVVCEKANPQLTFEF